MAEVPGSWGAAAHVEWPDTEGAVWGDYPMQGSPMRCFRVEEDGPFPEFRNRRAGMD